MMTQSGELADPKTKQILIVDDDEAILNLLTHVITKEGFRTSTSPDGEDALKQIDGRRPDLVVLDLMMPRYGGFEVLRRLQENERTSQLPIIVITGRYTDRSTADLIRQESNVVDFLEKPVKLTLLAGAVHRALNTAPPEPGKAQGPA